MTATSLLSIGSVLVVYGFLIIKACPSDEALMQLCYCESNFNGVLLDCSSSDFPAVLAQLQRNKGQLGLVQELLLQNASIQSLPANAFQGLFIKKLDLSNNKISRVDPKAFQGLQNVLQILTLQSNNLIVVPTKAISGLGNLLQLDLSKNKIGDLPSEILRNIPKAYDVNLSGNEICRIDKDAFKHLRHSLQSLNLGNNCMERVPAPAVRGFQQLLALHLNNNQFKSVDALQFMNLPHLNLINLAQNKIGKIHQQAFLNVPNLKFLYLSDNQLRQLQHGQFQPFQKMELLDLSRNLIEVIPTKALAGMSRLSQLYLSGNRIFDIQPDSFQNSSLIILLLSENRLTDLSGKMFTGLTFLQQLSLKNNQIKFIPQNAFYQLSSLAVLDLSRNKIDNLKPSTFLAQLNLFLLDLSHNKLVTVPYNAFNQRIGTVVLQENPLVCTERIHVIQNGVGVFVPGSPDTICGGNANTTNLLATRKSQPKGNPSIQGSFVQLKEKTRLVTHSPNFPNHGRVTPPPPVFSGGQFLTSLRPAILGHTIKPGWDPRLLPPAFTNLPRQPHFPGHGHGSVSAVPLEPPEGKRSFHIQTGSPPLIPLDPRLPVTSLLGTTIPGPATDERTIPVRTPSIAIQEEKNKKNGNRWNIRKPIQPSINNGISPIENAGGNIWPSNTAGIIPGPRRNEIAPTKPLPPYPFPPDWGRSSNKPNWQSTEATLPPGIIVAKPESWPGGFTEVDLTPGPIPEVKTLPPPKKGPGNFGADANRGRKPPKDTEPIGKTRQSTMAASTIIAVALTIVIAVLIVVFVTLCIVRHRNKRGRSSDASTATRTSAYVAAQAARLNYPTCTADTMSSSAFGHADYIRSPQPAPLQKTNNTGPQPWMYAPAGSFNKSAQY